jgi:hypothetical protein
MVFIQCVILIRLHGLIAPFDIPTEVNNRTTETRILGSIRSTAIWYDVKMKIAKDLNVFADTLHLQYRLSTDRADSLPCDLTSIVQFTDLVTRLRPLIVPPILANGRRSTRKLKPVTIQLFSKGDGPVSAKTDGKVHSILFTYTV